MEIFIPLYFLSIFLNEVFSRLIGGRSLLGIWILWISCDDRYQLRGPFLSIRERSVCHLHDEVYVTYGHEDVSNFFQKTVHAQV